MMSRFFRRGGEAPSQSENSPTNGTSSSSASSTHANGPAEGSTSRPRSTLSSSTTTSFTSASGSTPHLHLRPDESVQVKPAMEMEMEEEERGKVERLRRHMEGLIRGHYYHLPEGETSSEEQPKPREAGSKDEHGELVEPDYEEWEWRWLNLEKGEVTLRRYLKAAKGNEEDAIKRLEATLSWRRSFKPDIIEPDSVVEESKTGKHVLSGFDVHGRSVLYLMPARENTKPSERQIRYVVWGLERAIDLLPPGQTKITLVIDFANSSQAQNPSMSTTLRVLRILQNHYVERLGLALALHPPWFLSGFYSALQPFMDPVTKTKVKWNPNEVELRKIIPSSQLPKYYGGDWNFEFEGGVFWREICEFTGVGRDGKRVHESWSKVSREEEGKERERLGINDGTTTRGEEKTLVDTIIE